MAFDISSIFMGIFWFLFIILTFGLFIALGVFVKEVRKYKAKVLLRDTKGFIKIYYGKITGLKGTTEIKEVYLVPKKNPIELLKKKKINFNKPDDKYITRTDKGNLFFEGYYINGSFIPTEITEQGLSTIIGEAHKQEMINNWGLVKQQQQDFRRKGNNIMLWTTIGLVILGMIMIIGMIFIGNMLSESNNSIVTQNREILDSWKEVNTKYINSISSNANTGTGSPPDLTN